MKGLNDKVRWKALPALVIAIIDEWKIRKLSLKRYYVMGRRGRRIIFLNNSFVQRVTAGRKRLELLLEENGTVCLIVALIIANKRDNPRV